MGDPTRAGYDDASIVAVTVDGRPTRVDGVIELAEWSPGWVDAYEEERRRILAALGDRVRTLEHVGSTSVRGLVAKPRIDIVLGVEDSADEPSYLPDLEAAGYELRIREPDWNEHRVFVAPGRAVNLHVFTDGHHEIDRMTRFRDRLRNHPEELELYAATKRELGARQWKLVQNYADAKTPVVDEIMARAYADAGLSDPRQET